jgi:hypothetical protein
MDFLRNSTLFDRRKIKKLHAFSLSEPTVPVFYVTLFRKNITVLGTKAHVQYVESGFFIFQAVGVASYSLNFPPHDIEPSVLDKNVACGFSMIVVQALKLVEIADKPTFFVRLSRKERELQWLLQLLLPTLVNPLNETVSPAINEPIKPKKPILVSKAVASDVGAVPSSVSRRWSLPP